MFFFSSLYAEEKIISKNSPHKTTDQKDVEEKHVSKWNSVHYVELGQVCGKGITGKSFYSAK